MSEYVEGKSFDQDLFVRPVHSQFSVHLDPSATHVTKRDAKWGFLSAWVDKEEFTAEYGEKQLKNFEDIDDKRIEQWVEESQVRVVEYYRKVCTFRDLVELSDGRVMWRDEISEIEDELKRENVTVKRSRKAKSWQVEWRKLSGAGVLEGPTVENCQYIPIIRDCGKRIVIDNRERVKGMTRDGKDAQKSYNYCARS